MKLLFLPVHIMTNGTLMKKLEDARTEARELSSRQILNLVDRNFRLKTKPLAKKRKKVKQ